MGLCIINICDNCGGFSFQFKPHKEILYFLDYKVPFYKEKLTCEECGSVFHDKDVFDANFERKEWFLSIFYEDWEILSPLQIINAIRGLGISKEEFAEKTGIYLSDLDKIYHGEKPTKEFSNRFTELIFKLYKLT